jgi:hypothetical protein
MNKNLTMDRDTDGDKDTDKDRDMDMDMDMDTDIDMDMDTVWPSTWTQRRAQTGTEMLKCTGEKTDIDTDKDKC